MISRKCRTAIAFLAPALMAGCGGQADASDAPIAKIAPRLEAVDLTGEWRLASIPDLPVIPQDHVPRVVFFADRIRGHTGCNTVAGPLSIDGKSMRLGQLAVSRVGCPDGASQRVEGALLGALRSARSYGMHGHELVLVGDGQVELARFVVPGRR